MGIDRKAVTAFMFLVDRCLALDTRYQCILLGFNKYECNDALANPEEINPPLRP